MNKKMKAILMTTISAIVVIIMVMSLSACGKVDPTAFANAVDAWNNTTGEKSSTDNITLTASIKIGAATVTVTVKGKITRSYEGNKIKKVTGAVNLIEVDGISGVLDAVGSVLPNDIKNIINGLTSNNKITISNIVEGKIESDDDYFYLSGNVYLSTLGAGLDLDDILTEDALELDRSLIENIISVFTDDVVKLDMLSLFDVKENAMTSKGKNQLEASYDPAKALEDIIEVLFAQIDAFVAGGLDATIRETIEDFQNDNAEINRIMDIIDNVKGYIETYTDRIFDTSDLETILNKIATAENGTTVATFDKEKLTELEFNQPFQLSLTTGDVTKILDVVKDEIEGDTSIFDTIGTFIPLLASNGKITLNCTLNIKSTYTY